MIRFDRVVGDAAAGGIQTKAAKPLTNCINCGAPLHGRSCPYCGTRYDSTVEISGELSMVTCEGTITVDGKSIRVFLSGAKVEYPDYDECLGRDIHGMFYRPVVKPRRIFTLVEL